MAAGDLDPATPPAPAPGDVVAAPDFVGVGVQKAGTTWWYDTIAAHRSVHGPARRPKELHFFDRFWGEPFGADDIVAYRRWFARPAGQLAGEWTPRYLHDWWVPPMLAAAAPATRVLVLLRDPVERYLSGVAHELSSRGRSDPAIPGDALRRSCYAAQLERLLAAFPADQVLVQQFERCVDQPRLERSRAWDFLGLEPDLAAPVPAATNVTSGLRPEMSGAVLEALERELSADLHRLVRMQFDIDPARWPSAERLLGEGSG